MIRNLLTALAFAAFAALPDAAAAADKVTLNQQTIYYDVEGYTMDSLDRSIKRNRPRGLGDFIAETTFYFTWTYNYSPARDTTGKSVCRVSDATVVIDIEVHLPRFAEIQDAPEDIQRFWKPFIAALEKHELNHAEDFAETGAMIPGAIDKVVGPNCNAAQRIANDTGMQYVDLAQQKADEYDAETDHGTKEGALFPGF